MQWRVEDGGGGGCSGGEADGVVDTKTFLSLFWWDRPIKCSISTPVLTPDKIRRTSIYTTQRRYEIMQCRHEIYTMQCRYEVGAQKKNTGSGEIKRARPSMVTPGSEKGSNSRMEATALYSQRLGIPGYLHCSAAFHNCSISQQLLNNFQLSLLLWSRVLPNREVAAADLRV